MIAPLAGLWVSYLTGSIPTAFLVVKGIKGVDIRTIGSGNVGATNTSRILGKKYAILVFAVDVLKGVIPVFVFAPMLTSVEPGAAPWHLLFGAAAILGHNFPVFLQFRGGKGVATTIGVLVSAMPAVAGLCAVVWIVVHRMSGFVSVGSLAAAALIPLAQWGLGYSAAEIGVGAFLALLIWWRHQDNIRRLLAGREHRAGISK